MKADESDESGATWFALTLRPWPRGVEGCRFFELLANVAGNQAIAGLGGPRRTNCPFLVPALALRASLAARL